MLVVVCVVVVQGTLLHHVFQFCIPCIFTSPAWCLDAVSQHPMSMRMLLLMLALYYWYIINDR